MHIAIMQAVRIKRISIADLTVRKKLDNQHCKSQTMAHHLLHCENKEVHHILWTGGHMYEI